VLLPAFGVCKDVKAASGCWRGDQVNVRRSIRSWICFVYVRFGKVRIQAHDWMEDFIRCHCKATERRRMLRCLVKVVIKSNECSDIEPVPGWEKDTWMPQDWQCRLGIQVDVKLWRIV